MKVTKILVGTDFSDAAQAAIAIATKLAHHYVAPLVVAHIKPSPEYPGAGEDAADRPDSDHQHKLQSIQPVEHGIVLTHRYAHGCPAEQLLYLADHEHADLIVVGAHGESRCPDEPVGSVSSAILRQARCPVILVHQPRSEEP